jgi:creatinine amidohydrolase
MRVPQAALICGLLTLVPAALAGQTNPLWHEEKTKNYLPHMTWPEVKDLLTRTDMVIIPVGALEQHGLQGPMGTDFFNGTERALLVAQRTDVLVAPILLPGNSGYHMAFPGTITLSGETLERVYFEAAQSLILHGFRRFMFLNSHGGNQAITRFIVDRINQETAGIAVELGEAAAPFEKRAAAAPARTFDRHAGVGVTSESLYLTPTIVNLQAAVPAKLTMPEHLEKMVPDVIAGDPTATRVFLAEGLKPEETGKHTSTREMTSTGVWSTRDPKDATAERGRADTEAFVNAAVQFIERWKQLKPLQR